MGKKKTAEDYWFEGEKELFDEKAAKPVIKKRKTKTKLKVKKRKRKVSLSAGYSFRKQRGLARRTGKFMKKGEDIF